MSVGQRVKSSRKALGLSQLDLAKKAGITQATLSDLESDKSKGSAKLASIANVLGVRSFWLETGRGSADLHAPESDESTDHPLVKAVYSTQGESSGWIAPYEEYAGNFTGFESSSNSYALRIKGDSFGERISSGDILIIDQDAPVAAGDIVLVEVKLGKKGIWRLRFIRDQEVCLDPLLKKSDPITFDAAEILTIHKITAIIPR